MRLFIKNLEYAKKIVEKYNLIFIFLFILSMILLPFFTSNYIIRMFSSIFMYASLAVGFNIMLGYIGYAAFGNVAFFGLSAYITAILLNNTDIPFVIVFFIAAIISALYAILLGFPILRLRGHYFAIATLGIAEGTREIITILRITGGGKGISLPMMDISINNLYLIIYYSFFSLIIISLLVCYYILKKPLGYALRTIRGDEEVAAGLGINTTYYKVASWGISAFIVGLAGAIYAFWMGYIDPVSAFDPMINVKFTVIALLGGLGSVVGPLLGAFLFEFLSVVIWANFLDIHLAVLGIIIMLTIIFVPRGIMRFLKPQKE